MDTTETNTQQFRQGVYGFECKGYEILLLAGSRYVPESLDTPWDIFIRKVCHGTRDRWNQYNGILGTKLEAVEFAKNLIDDSRTRPYS